MAKESTEKICLQDELPIVLITALELNTFIKGYHVYKDTWIPKEGEQLDVFMEPDNPKDKFAVCVKVNKIVVGHKKVLREDLQKQSFSFCGVIHTLILLCKSLGKGVILEMERACKCLAD